MRGLRLQDSAGYLQVAGRAETKTSKPPGQLSSPERLGSGRQRSDSPGKRSPRHGSSPVPIVRSSIAERSPKRLLEGRKPVPTLPFRQPSLTSLFPHVFCPGLRWAPKRANHFPREGVSANGETMGDPSFGSTKPDPAKPLVVQAFATCDVPRNTFRAIVALSVLISNTSSDPDGDYFESSWTWAARCRQSVRRTPHGLLTFHRASSSERIPSPREASRYRPSRSRTSSSG